MAFVFFYAAATELMRLLVPTNLSDINPKDPQSSHPILNPNIEYPILNSPTSTQRTHSHPIPY